MATGRPPLKRAKIDKIVQAVHSSLVDTIVIVKSESMEWRSKGRNRSSVNGQKSKSRAKSRRPTSTLTITLRQLESSKIAVGSQKLHSRINCENRILESSRESPSTVIRESNSRIEFTVDSHISHSRIDVHGRLGASTSEPFSATVIKSICSWITRTGFAALIRRFKTGVR